MVGVWLVGALGALFIFCLYTFWLMSQPPIPEQERYDQVQKIPWQRLQQEQNGWGIKGFAIASNGRVAVGQATFSTRYVNVYSPDGAFLYAYCYKSNEPSDVIFDDQNHIGEYLSRGKVFIYYDESGEFYDLKFLDKENYIEVDEARDKTKTVDDKTYYLKNFFGYCEVYSIDSNGNRVDYYRRNWMPIYITITILALFLLRKFWKFIQQPQQRRY